jgi:hypothetical protein
MSIIYDPINIKEYPYNAVGDGVHDDTAAIQAALNFFSGTSSTRSGTIFFPFGIYKITSTLTFTGNQGASIRFQGDGTGATAGVTLLWDGSSGSTMWNFYGLNQAEFDNIIFNGNHLASTGLWFHYDATNAVGSGQVFFHKCFGYYCVGTGASASNGSAIIKLGDSASSFEVAGYVFDKCTFYGGTYENNGTQACVMALQSGPGNTEQFAFRDCNFGYAYYGFEFDNGNNELIFDNCQYAAVFAPVHAAGPIHIKMHECATEIVNTGTYAHQGYFLHGGSQSAKAIIDSCEIVIDGYNNAQNAIISWAGGHLELINCLVDGTGGGSGASNNTIASLSVASMGISGSCSVSVKKCVWVNVGTGTTIPQIPVYVGGTNKTDYVAGDSETNRAAIDLHQNMGAPYGSSSSLLPEFQAWPLSFWTIAPWSNITFGAAGLSEVYRGETRQLTTCYEIDYTALTAASTQQQITLGTIRTHQGVVRVIMEVVTPFKGGAISAMLTEAGYTGGTNAEWIVNKDTWTAAAVYGLASGDLGTALTGTVQGIDVSAWTTAKAFGLYFTATSGNLNTLTQGKIKLYVTTEFVDYL